MKSNHREGTQGSISQSSDWPGHLGEEAATVTGARDMQEFVAFNW
jgi:hypothetical protein